MMERRQIVGLWRRGGTSVLVTLIRSEGSSYRQPGARLLIAGNSDYAGTISGGCLETEVVRKAAWRVREGAVVERYSTLFDDTAEIPFGLGCGGIVDLLMEPVETVECQALLMAMEASLRGESATVVTWLPNAERPLRRVVLSSDRTEIFASEGLSPKKLACAHGLQPGQEQDGRYVEELRPPQRLIVLGAGDDAKPLVSLSALLGWSVTVADGRAQLTRPERFPEAERVVLLAAGMWDAGSLDVRPQDAVVLMTHSYEQDRELLARMLPQEPRYLGLLGARHRSSLLVSEVAMMLDWSIADCCERIYAPVGLDLGGDGPEAIALAVIAEVQACCMGKLGASRRLTEGDVAAQIAKGGSSRYLQMYCALDQVS
ncbi:XdhC family protein [Granulicella arctica]|uniref:Xanthine/CO dehydrogenase XdhC/CoxF family maturation factor n=1 Tax=Granulicella arctica TaxID=940613 RepID=A0A7Y9PGB0_9BACT|nr:XdhC/CoxI family protein [Granulicella arctica]NYF79388.1 xanthine/CO dehydrogenase XdhC/CoxF family maturation factor [Granulicella arctica]